MNKIFTRIILIIQICFKSECITIWQTQCGPINYYLFYFFTSENKKIMNFLEAIKQKTVTLDTLRYATDAPCSSPAASVSGKNTHSDTALNKGSKFGVKIFSKSEILVWNFLMLKNKYVLMLCQITFTPLPPKLSSIIKKNKKNGPGRFSAFSYP